MTWEDIKKAHPGQWLIIEAIEAHTEADRRILDNITVVDTFYEDNNKALLEYVKLHRKHREREMYVVHTSRRELDITETKWIGVRADL
jgi:hypothetical protein